MTDIKVAWAAGLFEGEGCITCRTQKKYIGGKSWRVTMSMKDMDIMQRFLTIVQVGSINSRHNGNPNHSTMHTWETGSKQGVVHVLNLFLPYLGERRSARAQEALDFIAEFNYDGRVIRGANR